MDNPLSKLTLDYWYKVMMVVGVVVFLLTGAGQLKAFPIVPTSLVSLGMFFIGVGEWINHPIQTAIIPPAIGRPVGVITGHPRNTKFCGIAFDIFGIVLICFGGYKFFA